MGKKDKKTDGEKGVVEKVKDTLGIGDDNEPTEEAATEPGEEIKKLKRELDTAVEKRPLRAIKSWFAHLHMNGAVRDLAKFITEKGMDILRFAIKNRELIKKIIFLSILEIRKENDAEGDDSFDFDDIDDLAKRAGGHLKNYITENPDKIEAGAEWIEWAIRIAILLIQFAGAIA